MRRFVAEVMQRVPPTVTPSSHLVRVSHLGPLAYRLGFAEHRDEYAASVIMADRRRAALGEVAEALGAEGIRLALIKGIAFVGNIYPDPAERPMQDIDILIPMSRFVDAMRCMVERGFQRVGFARKLSDHYHAQVFNRGDMMVELHRNIVQPYRTGLRIDEVWQRVVPDPQGSGGERLERVDELLFCLLHIARHELAVPTVSYVDAARLWDRLTEAERAELKVRAESYRATRAITAALSMTELMRKGTGGHPRIGPGSRLLPTTDDVLLGARPRRVPQIAQKFLLLEGPLELLGLGYSYGRALVDGWSRARTFERDMAQRTGVRRDREARS